MLEAPALAVFFPPHISICQNPTHMQSQLKCYSLYESFLDPFPHTYPQIEMIFPLMDAQGTFLTLPMMFMILFLVYYYLLVFIPSLLLVLLANFGSPL